MWMYLSPEPMQRLHIKQFEVQPFSMELTGFPEPRLHDTPNARGFAQTIFVASLLS